MSTLMSPGVVDDLGRVDVTEESDMRGYTGDKDAYVKRLRRIEGQIRGLQRMVENDEYCIDVLTQISAASKALQSVSLGLIDEHLKHCVAEAIAEGGDTADAKVREASDAIARLVRS
jgi:CsoR family transcriptional regulator, copper-sensing transcriptional repressor